jgi:heme/copper-type cytochrome/quinol oxidase subunit 2
LANDAALNTDLIMESLSVQTVLVLLIVGGALTYLVLRIRRTLRARKAARQSGCSDCGCH